MDLHVYDHAEPTRSPNYMLIPITRFGFNDEDLKRFNDIYFYVKDLEEKGLIHVFVRTPSGGISNKREHIRGARYDVRNTSTMVELTISDLDGCLYRFQVGYIKRDNAYDHISGRKAWIALKDVFRKFYIDIDGMAVSSEEGFEIKRTIPAPIIKVEKERYIDHVYERAHHLDLNSSYISGMCEEFPQLFPAFNYLYEHRKDRPINKAIMTHSQGFMQSSLIQYKFSHISKAGYVYTNRMIEDLAKRLKASGRFVIAYNTDGIWYEGDIFHDHDEGPYLFQWKNDHVNCRLRYKSNGCYEYIEDGKYHPVLRGSSSYDRVKSRDEWEWGDIYKGEVVEYRFSKDKGFYHL